MRQDGYISSKEAIFTAAAPVRTRSMKIRNVKPLFILYTAL
jgi:hypothetical protein